MIFPKCLFIAITLIPNFVLSGSIPPPPISRKVAIRKCCKSNQFYRDDSESIPCQPVDNSTQPLEPSFIDFSGSESLSIPYEFVYGIPNCVSRKPWLAYGHPDSCDKLRNLPDGKLRHYASDKVYLETCIDDDSEENTFWQDYNISEYCIDRVRCLYFSIFRHILRIFYNNSVSGYCVCWQWLTHKPYRVIMRSYK